MRLVARYGHRLLTDYTFDPGTGLWRHRDATALPPGLPDLSSAMTAPAPRTGDMGLTTQSDDARRLLTTHADVVDDGPTGRFRGPAPVRPAAELPVR